MFDPLLLLTVHRRSDQIVHRGVDDDDARRAFLHVLDIRHKDTAGADQIPSRLEGQRDIEAAEDFSTSAA